MCGLSPYRIGNLTDRSVNCPSGPVGLQNWSALRIGMRMWTRASPRIRGGTGASRLLRAPKGWTWDYVAPSLFLASVAGDVARVAWVTRIARSKAPTRQLARPRGMACDAQPLGGPGVLARGAPAYWPQRPRNAAVSIRRLFDGSRFPGGDFRAFPLPNALAMSAGRRANGRFRSPPRSYQSTSPDQIGRPPCPCQ